MTRNFLNLVVIGSVLLLGGRVAQATPLIVNDLTLPEDQAGAGDGGGGAGLTPSEIERAKDITIKKSLAVVLKAAQIASHDLGNERINRFVSNPDTATEDEFFYLGGIGSYTIDTRWSAYWQALKQTVKEANFPREPQLLEAIDRLQAKTKHQTALPLQVATFIHSNGA